ncbi:related to transposase [Sporisorium reilianum f. sp. reilianum]|uniref:Related to transposase n=1 Tax=Sporisorium reilianum f. sp. reilianum TaxID=72559 RepID=A0A2N8UI95_9BASI|nr:related to transposase [Sporisorium reilianum f. sp. reilianum]
MFGQGASERVVVPSGDLASRFRAQPGTQESATVIECIGSSGQVLPPLIITKGKRHTVGEQQQMQGILASCHFLKSNNSWTNSELASEWLENIFDPHTRLSKPSEWRLLIINSHRSHMCQAFCDVAWLQNILLFLLLPHTTHIMQPLDISIFGPLTVAYHRIVNTAAEHMDAVDKVQFGTFYTQAREKVLTQSATQKAFSDSGISLDPSPEKVLRHLPSGTPVPRSASAFNATLDATLNTHAQEPGSHDAQTLKCTLQQTNAVAQASIAVLEAEVKMLQVQQKQKKFAKRKLVAKGPGKLRRTQGNRQYKEEEVIAVPSAAVDDHDDASEDGNKDLLAPPTTPSPPPTHSFLDELDDGKPLSTIKDDDPGGFGFFETLPVPGPSRIRC